MKIIKEISHSEFEAEFLVGEFYKNTYRNVRKEYSEWVNMKEYSDRSINEVRHVLLEIERGKFLSFLPPITHWNVAKISIAEIMESNVINEQSWKNVFGNKRKVIEIAQMIHDGINDANHVRQIMQIKDEILQNQKFLATHVFRYFPKSKLIFLRNKKDKLSIIEGNHRAVALGLLYLELGFIKDFKYNVIVGDIGNKKCIWF